MGNAVVHFEISGPDQPALQEFYAGLFGWKVVPSPGPDGTTYGFVDTQNDGPGINGGIGASPDGSAGVRFYVAVPDIAVHLERVKAAGGRVLMERTERPQVTIAMFEDPQGNAIGLVEA